MTSNNDKRISKLLETSHKGRLDATGVLGRLWRELLMASNITPQTWTRMMTNYLNDPHNRIPKEGKKRSSDRNNLNKELSKPTISWNVFYKGVRLLAPFQLKIDITLIHHSGKTTTVSVLKQVSPLRSTVTTGDTNNVPPQ